MSICARGHRNGMFEDIEPDGSVWMTCMFCGDIQPTGRKMELSPGSPVMYANRYVPIDPPDYFEEQQATSGHRGRLHSDKTVDGVVEMWRGGTSPADIGTEFGITSKAAYGILRRALGRELVQRHTVRARRI